MVVEFTISLGTISNFESFSKFEGLEAHFTPESEPLLKLRSHHLPLFCCVTPLARRVCAAAETSVTYLHREEYVSSLSANDGNSASFKAEANDLMTGVEKEERGTEKNDANKEKYSTLENTRTKGKEKTTEPRCTTEGESCTSEGCGVARQGARGRCAANWFPISSKRRHTYGSGQNKDDLGYCSGTRQGAPLAKICARLEEEVYPS